MWTFENAKSVVQLAEIAASKVGAHVALTGGVLYKTGPRKDLDLVFYPDGTVVNFSREEVLQELKSHDFEILLDKGRVVKAFFPGGPGKIDLFFPEYVDKKVDPDFDVARTEPYVNGSRRIHTEEDLL